MNNNIFDPRIEIIKNVSSMVSAVMDMDQLMYLLIKTATKFTGAKASSLLLVDEDNKKMHFFIVSGKGSHQLKHTELNVGEGIAGWVAKEGTPVLIDDVKKDKRWSIEIAKMIDFDINSIACAPLKINGKVIGVIEIIDKLDSKKLTREDMNLLLAFADMAVSFLDKSLRYKTITKENFDLKNKLIDDCAFIGESKSINKVISDALKVAKSNATVLICGESGTGKELIAHFIHRQSLRRNNQIISINCGALPETMLERELFGHEKGSFTSADSRRIGLLEASDKGSLFLDEISEMPLNMQVKLLRFLQEGTFFRLGGTTSIKTDIRVIAATNRILEKNVKEGKFREDLFYRLNVIKINIPPLRERREDIPLLINYFLKNQSLLKEKIGEPVITAQAMNTLLNYDWPGNVRQLKNAIDRAIIMGNGKEILFDFLPDDITSITDSGEPSVGLTLKNGLNNFKKELIEKTLNRTRGNRTEAARILDIERTYLSKLLKDLDVVGQG